MDLKETEIVLIAEALARAASRLESYARWNPRGARPHDDKARRMRALRTELLGINIRPRAADRAQG
jgi:hypothetical protein